MWPSSGLFSDRGPNGPRFLQPEGATSLDPLSNLSSDVLRLIPWIVAACFAVVAGIWRPRRFHWTALGAVLLFAALNAGGAIYVLDHFHDARWASGGQPPLTAPSLADAPVVGQFLGGLDSAMTGVIGGVNDFLAFKKALPVALDFLAATGWALLVAFPLALIAVGTSYRSARRRRVDFRKYHIEIELLRSELDLVKRQIASDG